MAYDTRRYRFANNARSTLAVALSPSATELFVQSSHGDKFPDVEPTYDEIFSCILFSSDLSSFEVVYVTAKQGDRFTIERGKEGSQPLNLPAGVVIVHNVTAGFFTQIAGPPPSTPANMDGENSGSGYDLDWDDSIPVNAFDPVDHYEIWRSEDGGPFGFLANSPTSSYSDTTANLFEHSYCYKVRAVTAAGIKSPFSGEVCFDPEIPILLASDRQAGEIIISSDGGDTWYWAASIGQGIWGLAYSPTLNRLVGVTVSATAGLQFFTSDDGGYTWTARTGTFDAGAFVRDVCWSPELSLFVAVCDQSTNRVSTSPDGINWTARSASAVNFWRHVAWSPTFGLFIATAESGAPNTMTSPDGITWTTRTSGGTPQAIGVRDNRAIIGNSSLSSVFTSDDGLTWTEQTDPDHSVFSLAYSPSLDRWVGIANENASYSDDDGVNWTQASADLGPGGTWNFGTYATIWSLENERFLSMAVSFVVESQACVRSNDGITWAVVPVGAIPSVSPVTPIWRSILETVVAPVDQTNVAVAVAGGSATSRYSIFEGNAWRQGGTMPQNNYGGLAYSPTLDRWCAVGIQTGGNTDNVATSDDDGVTWTLRSMGFTGRWVDCLWSPQLSLFVACKQNDFQFDQGNTIATSPDGITWTSRSIGASQFGAAQLINADGTLFLAAGDGLGNKIFRSTDAITWTPNTLGTINTAVIGFAWSGSEFCAVGVSNGATGGVWTSADGTTWAQTQANPPWTNGISSELAELAAGLGLWVYAVGGNIYTSPDAITWTLRFSGGIRHVHFSQELETFFACSSDADELLTSVDGITWVQHPSTGDNHNVIRTKR